VRLHRLHRTTEQAIRMLGIGGATVLVGLPSAVLVGLPPAVLVGLPPAGARARVDPFALVDGERRILASNDGSVRPALDVPLFADLCAAGRLRIDELITDRRPLGQVEAALDDLASGGAIRTILDPTNL